MHSLFTFYNSFTMLYTFNQQIRNSSTMLLSAIMTRIFGVKKVQDERSPENKTTAMEFFTRFPTLRECILKKLEIAVTAMSNSERYFY